jgi:DNA-binding transcriptional LysR family regulator
MDLRHARTFVTVAELGTVSKAAARLHIAQPALSRQIRDLEQELGLNSSIV